MHAPIRKSLDEKLERIRSDASCKDFILADAKDADMAFGLTAFGRDWSNPADQPGYRSLEHFRRSICEIVQQGLVDMMLMSASSSEVLTIDQRLFAHSHVTPAVRMNDSTDIWAVQGGVYTRQPSLPFRTATIEHALWGRLGNPPHHDPPGADVGLYSITFNNDPYRDRETLEAYRAFRLEAESKGFRYFLEVFAPNACSNLAASDAPRFVNDSIARTLAGVTRRGRPLFLKMPYFGPAALEQLVDYDPGLVVGILGGAAGTTLDAFQMLWEARQYGARAALFGRKINNAEDQLAFVRLLRAIADGDIEPQEAVRAYHGDLQRQNITPRRRLQDDLQRTQLPVV
jgi:hypothetical protein